jgi:transketolase
MSPYPLKEKWSSFGWHVICIDNAHDFESLETAFINAELGKNRPTVIIQKSVKGKGVSFMEGLASWHGAAPNEEQYKQAMDELQKTLAELEGK